MGEGKLFFDIVAINVIIQTLHISSFIPVDVDILHIVNIVMLRRVFPWRLKGKTTGKTGD